MAMNAANLKAEILAAIQAKTAIDFPASVAGLAGYHAVLAEGIANAVVTHIATNAVVAVNSLVGVTACAAGAGTCTGTGAGRVS